MSRNKQIEAQRRAEAQPVLWFYKLLDARQRRDPDAAAMAAQRLVRDFGISISFEKPKQACA